MKIQVLGTGCPKCEKTTAAVKAVVEELGIEADIEKVTEINEIMAFGVTSTPAVAIDGEVKISGRVPSANKLKKLLQPGAGTAAAGTGRTKNIVIVAALLVAAAAVFALKGHKAEPPAGATETAPAAAQLPKLLELGSVKCVPCKMMAPILDELEQTFSGQLAVDFIDVWQQEGVGDQYGLRVIPTQIFFDADGKELFRHEGFFAREDILAKWKELGFQFTNE